MDQKYIVTLELSGTQIKGAVASVSHHPNGNPTLPTIEAIITEDAADCVQYGRVQNLITAGNITKDVIRRLQAEPILNDATIDGAYVAIEGRSLSSEQTTAEITLPNEMEISNEILTNLYIEASKNAAPNKRVLKVLPRKFYVDNQTMQVPVGALGTKFRGDFTLITCNPINQRNIDLILSDKERVDMPVKGYVVTQLALADMLLDEEDKQLGCVLVDLGHQTTTLSIYKDRALQYMVTLPMGSQNITRDISMGMNVTMEKAENAKCVNGDAMPSKTRTDEQGRINQYVEARAYEIAANINANIGYAKYKSTDLPGGFIIVGRGARLKNFDNLLSQISKMPVKHGKVPSNVNFAFNTNNIRPEDHLSLIALILRVSRNPKFENCITFHNTPAAESAEVVETTVAVETPVAPKVPQSPAYTPHAPKDETRVVDDENWDKDDNEEEDNPKKPKRPSKGIINILKTRLMNIVSADEMDNDGDLDS